MNQEPERLLSAAAQLLSGRARQRSNGDGLSLGVDLGTATMVVSALDHSGHALALRMVEAQVVRDGLVVDFMGAVDRLKEMVAQIESELQVELSEAASGFPPGVPRAEVEAVAHVLGNAGLDCVRLIDEPSAANLVLGLQDGAIVDVGGGTTGVAILQDGQVVFSTDEATGGTHFDLVIAGGLDVGYQQARRMKEDPGQQARLFGMVKPVMEKVATIISHSIDGYQVSSITLVGGAASFTRFDEVVEQITGVPTTVAPHTQLVTPLGIALAASLPTPAEIPSYRPERA